jgi:hypothetical protein
MTLPSLTTKQLQDFVKLALEVPPEATLNLLTEALREAKVTQVGGKETLYKGQEMQVFRDALVDALQAPVGSPKDLQLNQDQLADLAVRFPFLKKETRILDRIGEERRKKIGASLSPYPALAALLKR